MEIKKGDIAKVDDGSWSVKVGIGELNPMCSGDFDRLGHHKETYEVVMTGMRLPCRSRDGGLSHVTGSNFPVGLENDTVIKGLSTGTIIFIASTFLRVSHRCNTCPECGEKISP